jgi:hypothetical protein
MDKNQIEIIEKITSFRYIKRNGEVQNTTIKTFLDGKEKIDSYYLDVLIGFKTKNEENTIGIYGYFSEVFTKRIYWENFTYNEIKIIAETFELHFDDDFIYPSVSLDIGKNKLIATLSIKKSFTTDNYFLVIYYFNDGESRKNSQLYVYGIWEVQLSEEFKRKLYSLAGASVPLVPLQ